MKKNLLVLLMISTVLFSCRTPRYIYSPAPPNNPYFREKGESKLTAYYSASGSENEIQDEYGNGVDLQAAYAVGKHWALTADHFRRSEKQVGKDTDVPFFQSSTIRYKRKITSLGFGYFMPVIENKAIMFNALGGVGFGKFSFDDYGLNNGANYARYHNNDVIKWYVQPSINFFAGNHFRTSLIGKVSWVHYSESETNYTQPELEYLDLNLLAGRTLSFFEFTWNMQIVLGKGGMHLEGGLTISTDPFGNITGLEARNLNASIGLGFDFSNMKRAK